jgi:hypothetical protein
MSLMTSINSKGTASTTVFDAFGPSPSMVWRVRSCMAPGLSPIVRAAAWLIAASFGGLHLSFLFVGHRPDSYHWQLALPVARSPLIQVPKRLVAKKPTDRSRYQRRD